MTSYVLGFQDIDKTELMLVGGKGANLGELSRIAGIHVPEGFCISTAAFERIIGETPTLTGLLDQLAMVRIEDRARIVALSGEIRRAIEGAAIPAGLSEEITRALLRLGEADAYAVRSSATAEDLPTASFAGQQDTYLNIIGREAILAHISKCWASLFTERAVMYRLQNDFDHRKVHLAVVVQKMVFSEAAGILFTADPVSSDRKVLTIDASFGLGEAMVSGLVNTDSYRIRHGKIIDKTISTKNLAIYASAAGGTKEQEIDPEKRARPALTDEQALQLERIGRMVENHFGQPQDIEWCLVDGTFHLVQSRPITTLFPIPEAADEKNRVYISVGHQQMMTDAMKPLGLSFFLLITPAPMRAAGGRLFVDVTDMLTSAESRDRIVEALGKSDPLIKDAITTVIERDDFLQIEHNGKKIENRALLGLTVVSPGELYAQFQNDPTVVADLVQRSQASIEELKRTIQTKSGDALLDFILEDIQELKKILFDPPVILGGMNAASWLNDNINAWLGERSVADTLTQSVADNITSEMGLELLDVADVIRPFPKVMTFLQQVEDEIAWDELIRVDGGREAKHAIEAYIDKYGMRCAGEIDITRTRWSEKPATIVPMILSNVKNFEPGAGREKFEQGRQEALEKERELLARLKRLPEGEQKADDTEKMIDLVRRLSGYREYPKYGMVSRLFIYKQALMNEAERLVQAGVLREREDIYYLTLEELRDTVRSMKLDYQLVEKRREEYRFFERLTPSRVMTSDGEGISGEYRRADLPAGAIAGLAVSSGVVEGRARVLRKMEDAELAEGDILVTTFTDPSWTPAFVSIKGLVTEVGGLMTHGAVIAREYGLPAVVGVGNATTLIKEGQRIRVHGTEGYVELL